MSYKEDILNSTFLEVRKELKNYKTKICDSTNVSKKLMRDMELKHLNELIEIKKKHIKEIEIFVRDYEINSFIMNNYDSITRTIIYGMENNKNQIVAKVKFVIPELLNFYIDIKCEDVIHKILDINPLFTNVQFKILKIVPFDRRKLRYWNNHYMDGLFHHIQKDLGSIYTPKIDFCNCMVKVLFEW
jgi:hypothetical protein